MNIKEVAKHINRIKRKYPEVKVYFQRHSLEEVGENFYQINLEYITTIDLDSNLDPVSINIPIE